METARISRQAAVPVVTDGESGDSSRIDAVVQDGHDIPETVIRRRFDADLRHFDDIYKPLEDAWVRYDNWLGPDL